MEELQDYLLSSTSLADYAPDPIFGSVANDKSKSNLAANVATLSEDPIATFTAVKAELDTGNQSATKDSIMTRIQQQGIKANRDMFMSLMTREDVSDEEKLLLARQLASESIGVADEHDVISEQALIQPDGVSSDEGFVTRDQVVSMFKDVNELRRKSQSVINANNNFSDQTLLKKAGDIAELFVPFLDQTLIDGIRSSFEEAGIAVDSDVSTSYLLLGASKRAIADAFQNLPIQTRMEVLTKIEDFIKSNDSLVMDSNSLFLADYLQTILLDGSYSTSDEWIDNIVGLLDLIGVGGTLESISRLSKARKGSKEAKVASEAIIPEEVDVRFPSETTSVQKKVKPEDIELDSSKGEVNYSDVTARSVSTEVIHISPSENIARTNTGKARTLHELVVKDQSGSLAKSLSGANTVEYVARNSSPQLSKASGGVDYKIPTPDYINDSELRGPNPKTTVNSDVEAGRIYYYNSEKVKERTLALNDFQNAVGITSRPNLTSFTNRSDGIDIGVTYGPVSHGYANANDAIELVKYSLRDYGVTNDNITLFKNTPNGYEPVQVTSNMPLGDYLVRVDYKHRFSAKRGQVTGKRSDTMISVTPEESFLAKAFESFGPLGSFVRRSVFGPESTLDSRIMAGAFTAVDEAVGVEKGLVDLIKGFSNNYRKLNKSRKQVFVRAIQEANELGIAYDRVWAQGKWGMTNDEYSLLMDFKNAQDHLYWMENEDFIRTLKNKGYGLWGDSSGTKLVAKPIPRNRITSIRVLDPSTNQMRDLSKAELTTLYNDGGTVAQLRSSMNLNGEIVTHIMSSEKMDSGYLRSLTLDDAILNYRPGYFKVNYKDPLFVIEELPDGSLKTIATAANTQEAELFVRRMKQTRPTSNFFHRPDLKNQPFDNDDANFDIAVSQGRSAQRYRGLRLEDSSQLHQPMSGSNISDPIEAFQHSARSIASRVSMRDYLEAYKTRLLNSYSDVMPKRDGQIVFPDTVSQIKDRKTGRNTNRVKQAKALYQYVDMLESSNASILGNATKMGLNSLADVIGKIPHRAGSSLEESIRELSKKDPVALSAKLAFVTQIATNPLGQFITQSGGALMSFGKNPSFFLRKGGFMEQTWGMWAHRSGVRMSDEFLKSVGMSRPEWDEMMFRLENSGLPYAADANNLVRSGASSMSERDWSAIRGASVGVLGRTQKILSLGFDKGEFFNVTSAFLVFADEARRAGRLNNAEDWQKVAADARNFTFGMNKAGQFSYQTNELRIPLQYFQVVQKMFQLVSTNKTFSRKDKAKIALSMIALFGTESVPGLEQAVDKITEDFNKDPALAQVRDVLTNGLVQYGVNFMLSTLSGEEQNLAVKERLSPFDYNGAQQTVVELLSDFSVIEMFTESPSGQTYGKIGKAFGDGFRLLNLSDQLLPNDPIEFYAFVKSVASISSGLSNAFKAKMAWEYGKQFSSSGFVTDQETTSVEAIAKAFGFRTMDEARQFTLSQDIYGKSDRERPSWSSEDDVREWYKEVKREMFFSGKDPSNIQKMIYGNLGHKLFSGNIANLNTLQDLINSDAKSGDYQFVNGVLRSIGAGMTASEAKSMINKIPNLSQEKRAELIEMIDNVELLRENK